MSNFLTANFSYWHVLLPKTRRLTKMQPDHTFSISESGLESEPIEN